MSGRLPGILSLPIDPVLPDLLAALETRAGAVLQAPPGAGKTTRVPLALLNAPWLQAGKIVMLEPRRLAARAAARRMAATLGETVGETVGYRIRQDSRVGPKTRIEVVTEGILTRMIQDDPGLEGIGAVLFDEFHERSLNADLGLALCLESQATLRDDLRLLVMSATLDGTPIAHLMNDVPVITSRGRAYPVDIRWLEKPATDRFEDAVAALVCRALEDVPEGDLLVFLPGQGEIRRVETRLKDRVPDVLIAPLYGDLSQEAQDAALLPRSGRRKVVLATAIAETSLTIEGISVVVDGGRMRVPRFDPNGGMTRLVTLPVSKASAEQRRGRAGRLGPGFCYRLWTEAAHRALPAFTSPEIVETDLASLVLELARWGVSDPAVLAWLDPPPAAAFSQARDLLRELAALDGAGRITPHGRKMAGLPTHPRLAHMVIKGKELGLGATACDLAALLSERDILRQADSDLRSRLELLRDPRGQPVDRGGVQRCREAARQMRRQLNIKAEPSPSSQSAGLLLAFAYPDRIAVRRPGGGLQYRLSNGRGAFFREPEALAVEETLVVAELDGDRREARIFLAAPVALADIEDHFADQIVVGETIAWDPREEAVAARRQRRLGELLLEDIRLDRPPREAVTAALLDGIRQMGLGCLPWSAASRDLLARVAFLRRIDGDGWPDLSDAALMANLEEWLAPWLDGKSRRSHLADLKMADIIGAILPWDRKKAIETLAPTHVSVPSGSRVAIDYSDPERPVLAVRLQEMFGLADTPTIAGGRIKVTLHLLSPARRPVQVTQDLASFWANAYKEVKADLRGQYPKHYWPDDPMQAEPTARAKPRGR
ncbi:ATP-dependent helicase HrpB [Telmatospirillum sp.]|uniref:ATP-dependent helicase HrpB n=1 Tax=Telmatospirillum sp. TaxID=2079197 RepID=UPI0028470261|nr:ATP-dependent helicase HrpB [Telmatospirillum sp.]MDR3435904.1 ATP-dependent helicase HrpB [Telmatospirillum sp.]